MPRPWVMWALFLSSYMPLFVLIGIRSIGRSNGIAVASGVLALLGGIGTALFLMTARRKAVGHYQLLDVESRDSDVAAYAATYLLPFLLVFSGDWQDIASLAGFIAILGFVYVRSRLIYMNPVLSLIGYRLWRVIPTTAGATPSTTSAPWPRYLLARSGQVFKGQVIAAYRVTNDLLIKRNSESIDREED